MEYIINEDPSIFTERHEGNSYPFLAKEEIFSIVNEALGYAISLDFEKKNLYARCIIRVVDYPRRIVSEVKAIAPRFRIKSTFASLPYKDSDITFLGGGFTASAVSRKGRIGLICSAPDIILPDGRKGLKLELHMTERESDKSFNTLLSYKNKFEYLHSSLMDEISGTITFGEDKTVCCSKELSGKHIWKQTSFTDRKEKPIAIIHGASPHGPFSGVALTYDDSFTIFNNKGYSIRKNVKWKEAEGGKVILSNGEDVEVKADVFSSIHEGRGPFRKPRTFRYAIFNGKAGDTEIVNGYGYLEYPDALS